MKLDSDVKRRFVQSPGIAGSNAGFSPFGFTVSFPSPTYAIMHPRPILQMPAPLRLVIISLCAGVLMAVSIGSGEARAQELNPRFGVGANALLSTADGFGLGIRGRASVPVNADLSLAGDLGITAFILSGRQNADYIFDPQVSAIVSLPATRSRLTYVLFGMGGYIPAGGNDPDAASGPTIHGGLGWVIALQESSLFYEINPALIIRDEGVDVAIPFRVGVIF